MSTSRLAAQCPAMLSSILRGCPIEPSKKYVGIAIDVPHIDSLSENTQHITPRWQLVFWAQYPKFFNRDIDRRTIAPIQNRP